MLYEDQKAAAREAYESSKEAVALAKDDLLQLMLSTHKQLRALESDNGRPTRPFEPASAAQDTEALMAEAREYSEDLTVGEGIGWLNNDEAGYCPPTYSEVCHSRRQPSLLALSHPAPCPPRTVPPHIPAEPHRQRHRRQEDRIGRVR